MKLRLLAVSGLSALALTAAAGAQAATFTPNKSCYGQYDKIVIAGQGFTPNGVVAISRDGRQLGTSTANAGGAFAGSVTALPILEQQRTDTYTATDQSNPAIVANAAVLRSITAITIKPVGGNPLRTRRIRAKGFTAGKTVYAHIVRHKRKKSLRVGRVSGPCGNLSVKKRLFRRVKFGTYKVQFDLSRRYKRATTKTHRQAVIFRVTVFRTFHRSSAGASAVAERWQQLR